MTMSAQNVCIMPQYIASLIDARPIFLLFSFPEERVTVGYALTLEFHNFHLFRWYFSIFIDLISVQFLIGLLALNATMYMNSRNLVALKLKFSSLTRITDSIFTQKPHPK